jgi:hypothetical protein
MYASKRPAGLSTGNKPVIPAKAGCIRHSREGGNPELGDIEDKKLDLLTTDVDTDGVHLGSVVGEATVRPGPAVPRLDCNAVDFLVATAIWLQPDLDASPVDSGRGVVLDWNATS